MTDRELLELAAKAAGIVINTSRQAERDALNLQNPVGLWTTTNTNWNPLTDDGNALRLAVKCRIEFYFGDDDGEATYAGYYASNNRQRFAIERHADDPYAATRRAVVRAAAEIGKTK